MYEGLGWGGARMGFRFVGGRVWGFRVEGAPIGVQGGGGTHGGLGWGRARMGAKGKEDTFLDLVDFVKVWILFCSPLEGKVAEVGEEGDGRREGGGEGGRGGVVEGRGEGEEGEQGGGEGWGRMKGEEVGRKGGRRGKMGRRGGGEEGDGRGGRVKEDEAQKGIEYEAAVQAGKECMTEGQQENQGKSGKIECAFLRASSVGPGSGGRQARA